MGSVRIMPNGGCELNQKTIRCDRVAQRLRLMHLSPGIRVDVFVDDAPYEPVAALLDSLERNEINDVFIFPPFMGTTPSKYVKHWMRFMVDGVVNHPFRMVMISTERFKTWRENLIVLPASEFAIVERLATARIGQADCITTPTALSMDLLKNEHRLWLFDHADEFTQSCLLPRAATSCDFLSAVMSLQNVRWGTEDLEAVRSVAGEIGCNIKE
jgi:hypothetical protein